MPACLFCFKSRFSGSAYENTVFNDKEFKYIKCTNCGLVMLSPLPVVDDYEKMYPTTYQGGIEIGKSGVYDSIISLIKAKATGRKLLDYGCGAGRFIKELDPAEFEITGTEFNPDMVDLLKRNFPFASFKTIDELLKDPVEKFDIIFVSNVFEHLTDPSEILQSLTEKLGPNGIIVAEGPLEEQFNIAYLVRKFIFFIRSSILNRKASHIPFHIFRANYKNQLQFFENKGLTTLIYNCMESPWPFPSDLATSNSMSKKMQYYIAKISMQVSKLNKRWGNNFFYIGKTQVK